MPRRSGISRTPEVTLPRAYSEPNEPLVGGANRSGARACVAQPGRRVRGTAGAVRVAASMPPARTSCRGTRVRRCNQRLRRATHARTAAASPSRCFVRWVCPRGSSPVSRRKPCGSIRTMRVPSIWSCIGTGAGGCSSRTVRCLRSALSAQRSEVEPSELALVRGGRVGAA